MDLASAVDDVHASRTCEPGYRFFQPSERPAAIGREGWLSSPSGCVGCSGGALARRAKGQRAAMPGQPGVECSKLGVWAVPRVLTGPGAGVESGRPDALAAV
jgi:hypothetical protein